MTRSKAIFKQICLRYLAKKVKKTWIFSENFVFEQRIILRVFKRVETQLSRKILDE